MRIGVYCRTIQNLEECNRQHRGWAEGLIIVQSRHDFLARLPLRD